MSSYKPEWTENPEAQTVRDLENAKREADRLYTIICRALKRLGTSGRPHPNDISWTREILTAGRDDREVKP